MSDVTLNANQLATMLMFELQSAQLRTAASQLGGWMKLEREAKVLVDAADSIERQKVDFIKEWQRTIQIVSAAAMPKHSERGVIEGIVVP